MAIEKPLSGILNQDDFDMGPGGLVVVEEEQETLPGESLITELEDGGIEIEMKMNFARLPWILSQSLIPISPAGAIGSRHTKKVLIS